MSLLYDFKNTPVGTNTADANSLNLTVNPPLPDGAVLQVGNRIFTVDTDSAGNLGGSEQWDTLSDPLNWTEGQHVTTSLRFSGAYDDATLSSLAIEGPTSGDSIILSPAFDDDTFTYTAAVPNGIDAVTVTAATNNSNATVAITGDDTSTPNTANLVLSVGANTLTVTVTAEDTITTETYTVTVTRTSRAEPTLVPDTWNLIPSELGIGDEFRLIFLSSTRRDGSSSAITDYNTFVQGRAAAGHTDIQEYSDSFMAVGCTEAVDARGNTATTYTNSNKGVPIYWLAGNKVADEYEDFYDGDWDEESAGKNEFGDAAYDTSNYANYPLTGCSDDGTEKISGSVSSALGNGGDVTIARPNSTGTDHGPLSSGQKITQTFTRPMYGISTVFTVADNATLSNISIEGTADGQTVVLSPAFDPGTLTYTARVGNGIDGVTLTATKSNSNATVVITNDDNASTPNTADFDLIVGSNTLAITVTAMDTTTTTTTLTYTITVTRAESGSEMLVPGDWSLVPTGLSAGDSFRLLFLSSTRHDASSASIDTYNDFVQGRAANGHTDIQAYSDGFTVVGCTAAVDARDNTGTTFTNADRGIPIYWLNGNKVADEYRDFYDGSWDDEENDKNQSGNNGPDTSDNEYYPLTGCDHNGTEKLNSALGSAGVTVARPNSTDTGHGPLSSGFQLTSTNTRPMYGLSAVFTIVELSNDATLSDLTIEGATDGDRFTLSPQFDKDTSTYTASVANRFNAVTLTATKNDSNATVAINSDDDASTPNTADLDLNVGDNTLTVTVTAEDTRATLTYTITATRVATDSTDATLNSLAIEGITNGQTVSLNPAFNADTFTYTASVANWFDTVKLTTTKNNIGATVVITGDKDTNTPDTADLDLDVGANTLTVTVTAQNGSTTKTYLITVTRAAEPPAPTDCPVNTTWCVTLGVSYLNTEEGGVRFETWGFRGYRNQGDLDSTFSRRTNSYVVSELFRQKLSTTIIGTVTADALNLVVSPALPDGTVLQLGSRTFTTSITSEGSTPGHENWNIQANPLIWTDGQHVTASLKFPDLADDANLNSIAIEGTTNGQTVSLNPAFHTDTLTYTASVANRFDTVTLTTSKTDIEATVTITNDDETQTPDTADLDLDVGANTLTVTVTAEDGSTKTYTITVTRAAEPPAPTDCPAEATWCTTLGVNYLNTEAGGVRFETWGFRGYRNQGDLRSATFSHGGDSYTVSELLRTCSCGVKTSCRGPPGFGNPETPRFQIGRLLPPC